MTAARVSEFSKAPVPNGGSASKGEERSQVPESLATIFQAFASGKQFLTKDARSCVLSSLGIRAFQALFCLIACCLIGSVENVTDYSAFESVLVIGALALVYSCADAALLGLFIHPKTKAHAFVRRRASCSAITTITLILDVAFLCMTYASFGASAGVRSYLSDTCDIPAMEEPCGKISASSAMMFFAALTFVLAAVFSIQIRNFEDPGETITKPTHEPAVPEQNLAESA